MCGIWISKNSFDAHLKRPIHKLRARLKNRGGNNRHEKNDTESYNSYSDLATGNDNVTDCKKGRTNPEIAKNEGDLKPNVCQTCGLRFRSKRALDKHSTEHNDKGRYVCHECQECFEDLRALKEHRWTHRKGKAKEIKCEFCTLTFTYIKELNKHVRKKHAGDVHV